MTIFLSSLRKEYQGIPRRGWRQWKSCGKAALNCTQLWNTLWRRWKILGVARGGRECDVLLSLDGGGSASCDALLFSLSELSCWQHCTSLPADFLTNSQAVFSSHNYTSFLLSENPLSLPVSPRFIHQFSQSSSHYAKWNSWGNLHPLQCL